MMPPFADLRTITGGAESHAMGYDPMVQNPGDPWGRPMNYPRVWQLLFILGIDQDHTVLAGVLFAGLFFAGVLLAAVQVDIPTAGAISALIFSPAILLALERGNNDLLVFFLLALSIFVGQRSGFFFLPGVLLSSVLKLFPIFGIAFFLKEKGRRFAILILSAVAVFALYAGISLADIKRISAVTEKGVLNSYGINVLWRGLGEPRVLFASYLVVTLIFLGAVFWRSRSGQNPPPSDQRQMDAFRVGAGIYLGTFMTGDNWDYRLMFLLFTVPLLVRYARSGAPVYSPMAGISLLGVILSSWHLVLIGVLGTKWAFYIDEFADWLIFAGLAALFVATLPDRLWPDTRFSRVKAEGNQ